MALDRTAFNALVDDDGSGEVGTYWNKSAIDASILDPIDADAAFKNASNTFVGDQTIDGDLFVTGEIDPVVRMRQLPKINQLVGDPTGSRMLMSKSLVAGLSLRHDDDLSHGRIAVGNYDTQTYQPLLIEAESVQFRTGINPPGLTENVRIHASGGVTVGLTHNDPGAGVLYVQNGLGATPLNAASLTGVVPGASLPAHYDFPEMVPPNPGANAVRLYSVDYLGYSFLESRDSGGTVLRISRDFVVVGKVNEPAGITRGQVVFIDGSQDSIRLLKLAKADSRDTVPAIGYAMDSGGIGTYIRVLTAGIIKGVDTSMLFEGERVFLSEVTFGGMTSTAPSAPNLIQRLGHVLKAHATEGEVSISIALAVSESAWLATHASMHGPGGRDPITDLGPVTVTGKATVTGSVATPVVNGASSLRFGTGGVDHWEMNGGNLYPLQNKVRYLGWDQNRILSAYFENINTTYIVGYGGLILQAQGGGNGINFVSDSTYMYLAEAPRFRPHDDNLRDLGHPTFRWKDLYMGGTVTAAGLGTTPLNATNLTSGTVPDARLSVNVLKHTGGYPGGTTNFLRADGTFAAPPGGGATFTNPLTVDLGIRKVAPALVLDDPSTPTKKARFSQVWGTEHRFDLTANLYYNGTAWAMDDTGAPGLHMFMGPSYFRLRTATYGTPVTFTNLFTVDTAGGVTMTGDALIQKTVPTLVLDRIPGLWKVRVFNGTDWFFATVNASYNGTTWTRDDLTQAGASIQMSDGTFVVQQATGNPTTVFTPRLSLALDTGNLTVSGGITSTARMRISGEVDWYALEIQRSDHASIVLTATGQAANAKRWRILNYGQQFKIETMDDAEQLTYSPLILNRNGDTTINGAVTTKGAIWPGRQDNGAAQSSWSLQTHASYGLYSNTGLYLGYHLWVQGGSGNVYANNVIANSGSLTLDAAAGWATLIATGHILLHPRGNSVLFQRNDGQYGVEYSSYSGDITFRSTSQSSVFFDTSHTNGSYISFRAQGSGYGWIGSSNAFGYGGGWDFTIRSAASLVLRADSNVLIAPPIGATGYESGFSGVVMGAGYRLGVNVSSRRFKRAIETLRDPWPFLLKLRPVEYTATLEPVAGRRVMGFIAEEVFEVDRAYVGLIDNQPTSVNYERFTAPLVAAVQQLLARVQALEAKVRAH